MVATKSAYAGLFMVALATLMYEILLTRIFSVTMWYHFAFVAVSIAMFGMTVGAIAVYLRPDYFTNEQAKYHLALSSLLFALTIVFSFLMHLSIPFNIDGSIRGLYSLALTYVVISVPFVFSGICVCLALTKFPQQVSKLYASDLVGAAVGCLLVIYTLKITDGPTAVIVVALLATIGAAFFAAGVGSHRIRRSAVIASLFLAFFAILHTVAARNQVPLLRLMWVKGSLEERPLYEKWNSFSRIAIRGNPDQAARPFGWGLSPSYPPNRKVRQLMMTIDAAATTFLTAFDGNLNDLEHLRYDIINTAHYLRPHSKVLVVGTGGGRDILSALVFGQKSVVGVEINEDIINTVNQRFGDFTGHLDRNPRLMFINDEARSYIARQKNRFDIIQVSLIDTWAATAAGAFVLTENSLYTIEAWKVFLERLLPSGILTFSRFYFRDTPGEMYRLTSLASTTLMEMGVKNPRNHIFIVRNMVGAQNESAPDGVGTILVSKEPFSDKDIDILEGFTRNMQFELVLTPRFSLDTTFATIASGKNLSTFTATFPINITAPTDDSPFFFHMLRLKDAFNPHLPEQGINMTAVSILAALLGTVIALTFLCILVPLNLTTERGTLRGTSPLFIFFSGIGFGYMLIEISQMQRLTIFLGHPTYGLSVMLFALLLSSGLGSYFTQKINDSGMMPSATTCLLLLLGTLVVFGKLTPYAIAAFQGSRTMVRIFITAAVLFPLGFCMGMAFPLGMRLASNRSAFLTPWLWGINGATSVCGSVIAVAIALSSSISTSFWTGVSCYAVAFIAFVWATRKA